MPSPESLEIRKTLVRDSVPDVSIQEERRQWEAHAATLKLPEAVVLREEALGGVPCLWVHFGNPGEQIVLYVHGGGLIAGSPLTHREFAARLAQRLDARVLLVDYRLAPEAPHPAALDDVVAVYSSLTTRVSPSGIVLGAESTGAALGLALLLRLKGEGAAVGPFSSPGIST